MVGPRTAIRVESPNDRRWAPALDLLEAGEAGVSLGGLDLFYDGSTGDGGRRLHVEFASPSGPLQMSGPLPTWLGEVAVFALERARVFIGGACAADPRFRALVAESDVIYEFVEDYGLGTVLLATARGFGPLRWKQ